MKLNWGKNKLTFVIIPDNAHRPVVQLRFTPLVLYAAAVLLFGVLLWSLYVYGLRIESLSANEMLQTDLNGKTSQFTQEMAVKNKTIEQLQTEVIRLSEQAKEVQTKIEEVKKLEEDLRSITGGELPQGVASATTGENQYASKGLGLGGEMIPVKPEDIVKLSEETLEQFGGLTEQMSELQVHLAQTREEVLQKQQLQRITPDIWPIDSRTITSPFGYRKDPFTFRLSFHSGLDIAERENTKVKVTADGVVASTGYDNSRGNNILIDHSNGIKTWYMHLNKILVSQGDKVKKSDYIGLVGSTGRSTGAHLHYEVLKQGQSVDPRPYLK
ncbi:M23 family metallopeptidase [Paenibacillus allorhizosphaerae]|uniref:M23ase beta-sheet core domain-containing protein n=1 Tax=Paenibacillus allorhizosphaerae TaxID=2849866 RepID=A0ABM8VJL1_9BACL|nr:M23 family metallopeptidase [Paenibacillus allorhizosphaerae]CAG7645640.1 hypothetical protein PAECIP111802_03569 [Paenibacillus allorhizosphaerae]